MHRNWQWASDFAYCQFLYRDGVYTILNRSENQQLAADVIWDIICGTEPERACNGAIVLFGRKFSVLSYLFFARDSHRYVPVSPTNFDRIFSA